MNQLKVHTRRITDAIYDVMCDTHLTPGQSLTVLNSAKEVLEQEMASLHETIGRVTGIPKTVQAAPDCPHAAPFMYCNGCKVSPCPVGLDAETAGTSKGC